MQPIMKDSGMKENAGSSHADQQKPEKHEEYIPTMTSRGEKDTEDENDLKEYSEEEGYESDEGEGNDQECDETIAEDDEYPDLSAENLRAKAAELSKSDKMDEAIGLAVQALKKATAHAEDEMDPSLGPYYLDYGHYLLANVEATAEVLSAKQGTSAVEQIQQALQQAAGGSNHDHGDDDDDVLAFQMLDLARVCLSKSLVEVFPVPEDSVCIWSPPAIQPPAWDDLNAVPFPDASLPIGLSTDKLELLGSLSFAYRRLGDLYSAQPDHVAARDEFWKGLQVVGTRLGKGAHPLMLRQNAVLYAQTLQWNGDLPGAFSMFKFAKKIYEYLKTVPPSSPLAVALKLPAGVFEGADDFIEDLDIIIADVELIKDSGTAQLPAEALAQRIAFAKSTGADQDHDGETRGSPNARTQAILNALPQGALDGIKGTVGTFDKSAFAGDSGEEATAAVEMVAVRRKKRSLPEEPGNAEESQPLKKAKTDED